MTFYAPTPYEGIRWLGDSCLEQVFTTRDGRRQLTKAPAWFGGLYHGRKGAEAELETFSATPDMLTAQRLLANAAGRQAAASLSDGSVHLSIPIDGVDHPFTGGRVGDWVAAGTHLNDHQDVWITARGWDLSALRLERVADLEPYEQGRRDEIDHLRRTLG